MRSWGTDGVLNTPSPKGEGFDRRLNSPKDLASFCHFEVVVLGFDILLIYVKLQNLIGHIS